MMIDVDRFKAFNDTYGHAAGDVVLKRVAGTIRDSLKRPGDFVARYGGEEFVVVLPETDIEGGRALAEQIRAQVEDLHIPHPEAGAERWVTISVGGVTLIPTTADIDSEVFCQADKLLYEAKHGGRNRVVWAEAPRQCSDQPEDAASERP